VMAVLGSLVSFGNVLAGFRNRQLVEKVSSLWNAPYTSRQATYDLRRLKRKGLIMKFPGTRRYQLTPLGRRVGVLFVKAYGRVLTPGLAALDVNLAEGVAKRIPLACAWRKLERALDEFFETNLLAP